MTTVVQTTITYQAKLSYELSIARPMLPKRHVTFGDTCSVVLIPSRQEYFDAGIDLWWTRDDHKNAQFSTVNELKKVMEFNPRLTLDMAMRFLYQPSKDYNNSFFQFAGGEEEKVNSINSSQSEYSTGSRNGNSREDVSILIINKNYNEGENTAKNLAVHFREYTNWTLSFHVCTSLKLAAENVKGRDGNVTNFDVLLVDEEEADPVILRYFRNVYGNDLLIGVAASTQNCDSIQRKIFDSGFDFIWPKPIALSMDMLPILLMSRRILGSGLRGGGWCRGLKLKTRSKCLIK